MTTEGTNNIQDLFQDILKQMKASEERITERNDAKFGRLEGRLEQLTTYSNYFEREMLGLSTKLGAMDNKLEAMDNESLLMKSEVQEMRTSFSENPKEGSSPRRKRYEISNDISRVVLVGSSSYVDKNIERDDD